MSKFQVQKEKKLSISWKVVEKVDRKMHYKTSDGLDSSFKLS